MKKKTNQFSELPANAVAKVLAEHCEDLYNLLYHRPDDFINFKITLSGEGYFLAVAKKYDDSGTPVICFGGGSDPASCMVNLSTSIGMGKWKIDKWANSPA